VYRLISLTVLVLLASRPAYAYLDPGTGSVLVQGLLAALAVASAAIAAFWSRIKRFLAWRQSPRPPVDRSGHDATRS
jgi:hypothetical protein